MACKEFQKVMELRGSYQKFSMVTLRVTCMMTINFMSIEFVGEGELSKVFSLNSKSYMYYVPIT